MKYSLKCLRDNWKLEKADMIEDSWQQEAITNPFIQRH